MLKAKTAFQPVILWGCGVLFLFASATPGNAQRTSYRITLENLTSSAPDSGQPFSPPVFFTHDGSLTLWQIGEVASDPLRQIAEEGNNAPLLSDLSLSGSSVGTVRVLSGPQMPGTMQTFTLTTNIGTHSFLSNVWMLGRTNDGFAGQAGIDLTNITLAPVSFDLFGLDAGTEVNNELANYLPALGGVFNDPENGVVDLHPGISGDADAPASWNFSGPVARLTINALAAPEPGALALCLCSLWPMNVVLRRKRA